MRDERTNHKARYVAQTIDCGLKIGRKTLREWRREADYWIY